MSDTATLECTAESRTTHSDVDARLTAFVATLSVEDARIMERRWGLGRDAMSLLEIAEELGLRLGHVGRRAAELARDHARSTAKTTPRPDGKPRTKRSAMPDGRLEVCGMSVTRHGDDMYRIDDEGAFTTDQVGEIIHQRTDADGHKNVASLLNKYDRWLANGYRGARSGTQWPHPTNCKVRLGLAPDRT